jgi:DNA-binding transcriptional LysR family regulator
MLIGLYREGSQHHLPTLIKRIKMLEEKLGVPLSNRIPNENPNIALIAANPRALDVLDRLDMLNRTDWERLTLLKEIYNKDPEYRRPPLIKRIKELEEKLEVPQAQRIPDPMPAGELPEERSQL